jgi:drug/metabolite transporter (DMT)-like permease
VLHALGLAAAILISSSAILVRLADVSASTAAFFRPLYALPVLALLYVATRHGDTRSRGERLACYAAGALMGTSFTLWNYSIQYVGAGLATLLGNTQVIFVALITWLVFRDRPSRGAFIAVPVVFAGVVLVTGLGQPDAYGERPVLGVLFGLANAVSYTIFLLTFRRAARGLRWPSGPLLDASVAAAATAFLFGVVTDPSFDLVPHWPAHGWLLLLALGPQVVGWWIIIAVLPRLPALDTSVILVLQPVLTVVWGFLLFQEYLSWLQWAGVALVVLGIAGMTINEARRRSAAVAPA